MGPKIDPGGLRRPLRSQVGAQRLRKSLPEGPRAARTAIFAKNLDLKAPGRPRIQLPGETGETGVCRVLGEITHESGLPRGGPIGGDRQEPHSLCTPSFDGVGGFLSSLALPPLVLSPLVFFPSYPVSSCLGPSCLVSFGLVPAAFRTSWKPFGSL